MQLFYTPDINGIEYLFTEEESKHAIRVLRLNVGDQISMVDGKGNFYEAVITDAHPKRCKVLVQNVVKEYGKRNYFLHMAISPLKNPDRFEWFLEKATEIGIDEITPLLCERTEKKNINLERSNRILESAMKQSIKAYHPVLNPLTKLSDLVQRAEEKTKMIATCEGSREFIRDCYHAGESAIIMIGPEGDFTAEEILAATNNQFHKVTLGESRLRTETAGIAACHSISFMNLR